LGRKIWRKKVAVFIYLKILLVLQRFYHNIGFQEKRLLFARKLAKIAENCCLNTGPGKFFSLKILPNKEIHITGLDPSLLALKQVAFTSVTGVC
jgi:hypothetical protein